MHLQVFFVRDEMFHRMVARYLMKRRNGSRFSQEPTASPDAELVESLGYLKVAQDAANGLTQLDVNERGKRIITMPRPFQWKAKNGNVYGVPNGIEEDETVVCHHNGWASIGNGSIEGSDTPLGTNGQTGCDCGYVDGDNVVIVKKLGLTLNNKKRPKSISRVVVEPNFKFATFVLGNAAARVSLDPKGKILPNTIFFRGYSTITGDFTKDLNGKISGRGTFEFPPVQNTSHSPGQAPRNVPKDAPEEWSADSSGGR